MDSAVEKAREIKQMIADGAKLHAILEEFNCWGPQICDALLSSHSQLERMREALQTARYRINHEPLTIEAVDAITDLISAALTNEEK